MTIYFHLEEVSQLLYDLPSEPIQEVIDTLFEAYLRGSRIYIIGNGGSAATASHMATDLNKMTIVPGQPRFKAIALTDNVPAITAWANDEDFTEIFSAQLYNLVSRDDVLIAISTSGRSPNITQGVTVANQCGAITVGLTGLDFTKCGSGHLSQTVDHCIQVPSKVVSHIEDVHSVLNHVISEELKRMVQAMAAQQ
jgi:D-sedoheptulose 7-phosphate isomerase